MLNCKEEQKNHPKDLSFLIKLFSNSKIDFHKKRLFTFEFNNVNLQLFSGFCQSGRMGDNVIHSILSKSEEYFF